MTMRIEFRIRALVCLLVAIAFGARPCGGAELGWKAGFGRKDITPSEPLWLSGYGSREHPSTGTRIPIWAKACVLQDTQGVQGVIVSLDLVGVDRDTAESMRKQIHDRTGIPSAHVALCCSHTHTGPVVGRNLRTMYFYSKEEDEKIHRYTEELIRNVVGVVAGAASQLQPVQLSWGIGFETIGVNRRNNPEPLVPAHRSSGQLRGPVDYDVPVLRLADAEGAVQGVIFGYACHATVLSDDFFSGDYPGFAQIALEKAHPGMQAMFVAGCGADVNPLPRRTPELAQGYGDRLAMAVDRVLQGVLEPISSGLQIRYAEQPLAFDRLPSKEELEEKVKSKDRFVVSYAQQMLATLQSKGALPSDYPYPTAVWKLGQQLTWITLGGEVVVDYSLRLKREYGRSTWVSGYSHDVMAYIPSRRVWDEGGYEGGGAMIYYGLPTRWSSDVEDRILQAVQKLYR